MVRGLDVTKDEKVEAVTNLLLELAATPEEALEILVPVSAAALDVLKAEPVHVQNFFLRVTRLLDYAESKRKSERSDG